MTGTGNSHLYGPQRLLDHNIILVTGNYRLGAFGFLSTLTEDCPGNYGLKDQLLMLNWVKENIETFGGNSSDVTIFGQSAGGASVGLHMFSHLSKGEFLFGVNFLFIMLSISCNFISFLISNIFCHPYP